MSRRSSAHSREGAHGHSQSSLSLHHPSAAAAAAASMNNNSAEVPRLVINNQYVLVSKVDRGAFGHIFRAKNIDNNKLRAVKVENPNSVRRMVLARESQFLDTMMQFPGYPTVYYRSVPQSSEPGVLDRYNFMVMEYLGPNLNELLFNCGGRFSSKTSLMIITQLLHRVRLLHNQRLVHGDLKPQNLCMGRRRKANTLYLIDFGIVREHTNATGQHIAHKANMRSSTSVTGSVRFCSINAHGCNISRRDDLVSIGIIAILFLRGSLPWSRAKQPDGQYDREEVRRIKEDKLLGAGREQFYADLPAQVKHFMDYSLQLRFDEEPDYDYLMHLWHGCLRDINAAHDFSFDWWKK